jgi:hypothetical protein
MNANYGLFPPLAAVRGREKRAALARRAAADLESWIEAEAIAPSLGLREFQEEGGFAPVGRA